MYPQTASNCSILSCKTVQNRRETNENVYISQVNYKLSKAGLSLTSAEITACLRILCAKINDLCAVSEVR